MHDINVVNVFNVYWGLEQLSEQIAFANQAQTVYINIKHEVNGMVENESNNSGDEQKGRVFNNCSQGNQTHVTDLSLKLFFQNQFHKFDQNCKTRPPTGEA